MKTQADKLKNLVQNEKPKDLKTRVIAITSGKGGVGKTTITANLGYALSALGFKVALFDADIGLANLDVMLRVNPKRNILNVLKNECTLKDIVIEVDKNFYLIPGESGEEIINFADEMSLSNFLSQLDYFEDFDFFLIDTSAGIDKRVQTFLDAADDVIIVTVPEPAAITDAYAMVKVISEKRDIAYMILNEVHSPKEANNIFGKIINVAKVNLRSDFRLLMLGYIKNDKSIYISSTKRLLFTKEYPNSSVSEQVFSIARKIAKISERKVLEKEKGLSSFFKKIFSGF
ncbi:P-loop NTPase [Caminibacter pacificus]|uniref:Flagellar biosynthesis protein FlhG n=1 Tax=Caminibacter pacificus TaxID=1424653 RepID=A0AAJ4RDJ2_9BACT|nr:P-loop NTPase [Caminibacter pacificus]NPA87224.1 MinD/ParA family protein [Campylobacterota bacterium]QCI28685.1 MinD/ParA family protein [Caminibacter pacificus]ROR40584.1 flagellar biosynthesis protein FlhG [Caminibacter pacificus]